MARLIVFRGVFNELATANKPHTWNYFGNGRLLQNVRFSSSAAGNERTEQEQEQSREERIRREKRLVGLVIGSSVGLNGSLYFLFRRRTNAKADSKTPSIDLRKMCSSNIFPFPFVFNVSKQKQTVAKHIG